MISILKHFFCSLLFLVFACDNKTESQTIAVEEQPSLPSDWTTSEVVAEYDVSFRRVTGVKLKASAPKDWIVVGPSQQFPDLVWGAQAPGLQENCMLGVLAIEPNLTVEAELETTRRELLEDIEVSIQKVDKIQSFEKSTLGLIYYTRKRSDVPVTFTHILGFGIGTRYKYNVDCTSTPKHAERLTEIFLSVIKSISLTDDSNPQSGKH